MSSPSYILLIITIIPHRKNIEISTATDPYDL